MNAAQGMRRRVLRPRFMAAYRRPQVTPGRAGRQGGDRVLNAGQHPAGGSAAALPGATRTSAPINPATAAAPWSPQPAQLHRAALGAQVISPYVRHAEGTRPAPRPGCMGTEEDDMSSTLTPTCSFCGLRFANRPLLGLHVREDHLEHGSSAESGHGMPADAPAPRPDPRSPANGHPGRATDSSTKARTTMTVPRPPHTGWARTGLRRVTGAFRRANAEFRLASEIMLRPAGVPRPRQPADPPAEPDAHQAATSGRTDRAA